MKLGGGETGYGRAGWMRLDEDMFQLFHKSQEFLYHLSKYPLLKENSVLWWFLWMYKLCKLP
jgi:hypothetical protein